jgi:hypothetical protein
MTQTTNTQTVDQPCAAAQAAYFELMFHRQYVAPHGGTGGTDEDGRVYHTHHIAPKSIQPGFDKDRWNLVRLSFEEHIRAHELLIDATSGEDKIAMSRALACMTKMYRDADGSFDVEKAAEAARIANEANSEAQSERLKKRWGDPMYRAEKSRERRTTNRRNWAKKDYRARQRKAIIEGRRRSFEDKAFKEDVYARQAAAISGEKHFRFRPVNIYCHDTGLLVAEGVCLREWCREKELDQPHLFETISADRSKPSSRENRAHHKGYFARYLNEIGAPVGDINPAVPQAKPNAGKLANVFRYEDDSLYAANIIVSQFVKTRVDGKKLSQSVLSQTAYADLTMPSSTKNPHQHKGFYIEYVDDET